MYIKRIWGFQKKDVFSKQQKILYEMIDLAIVSMVENDDCYYCCHRYEKPIKACQNIDLCKSNLFYGLKKQAQKRLKGEKISG